jgi:VWFA-related protein
VTHVGISHRASRVCRTHGTAADAEEAVGPSRSGHDLWHGAYRSVVSALAGVCRAATVSALAGFCWAVTVSALAAAPQAPPRQEAVNVARVLIDARVVDDDGEPLVGLEPADFDVRIDGESVRVESAEWIGGDTPTTDPIAANSLEAMLVPSQAPRLVVFVVQKSLEGDRAIGLLWVLQDSERLLAHLTPTDRVAVVSFDFHLKIWLDFTSDLERVARVLADDVMFRNPPTVTGDTDLSLVARLSQEDGRSLHTIEDALERLGKALQPLPGSKSVVLLGYGFGRLGIDMSTYGATKYQAYEEARDALHAARAAVFSLDITHADYHTFEHGLQAVSAETGGFFARMYANPRRSVERVANALVGHYVLFVEPPAGESGVHTIEVELVEKKGEVFARTSYID